MPVEIRYFKGRKSRVVQSFIGFLLGSALNIIKAFRDYKPFEFFGWLGLFFFSFGLIASIFTVVHYIVAGSFTPYIFVAFLGIYLVSLGLIIWLVGLFADMLDRIRNNQEKILYMLKEERFGKYVEKEK